MNFYDFFVFVPRFALANIVELYHIQNPKETALSSTETANHFVYNLMSIRNNFNAENICNISEQNRNAFSDIIKILEEESFSRLLVALSKAHRHRTKRLSQNEGFKSEGLFVSDLLEI
uniref:Uncharacterized protein n=1 Tax=Oryza glumipatula TaxID=40148 RepID=A0A0D9YAA5_9ORYZ